MLQDVGQTLTQTISNLFQTIPTDEKLEQALKEICNCLLRANVSPKLVVQLRNNIRKSLSKASVNANKAKLVQQSLNDELCKMLSFSPIDPIDPKKANIVLFVGLQGCGKTTSVCKFAKYYAKKGFKVGIVCADTFRAGAFDQVKQNALKIKVPFYGSKNPDPVIVAKEGVTRFLKENFNLILIDSSGRNTQEKELFDEMQEIIKTVQPTRIIFVMDAGIGQAAEQQAIGFKNSCEIGSILITKLDGTEKAGGALTSVAVTKCSIEFLGTGEGMDDFEKFDTKRFVSRMLGYGDIEGLFEKVSDLKIDETELLKKIEKGEYYIRDFYEQFQQLMSLGPLKNVLQMMPGGSQLNIPSEDHMRKLICIFDSLATSELDSDGKLFDNPQRVLRVARGSGTNPKMVIELIGQYKQISSLMKKLGKMPGFEGMLNKDPSKMSLTEKTKMKNQMKGMLPKDLFSQMSQMFK